MTTAAGSSYRPVQPLQAGTDLLSVGQIAKAIAVSPRCVAKWIDSGRLPGYRLPESEHRRVRYEDLVQFVRANDMPVDILQTGQAILAGLTAELASHARNHVHPSVDVLRPQTMLEVGMALRRDCAWHWLILDATTLGSTDCLEAGITLRATMRHAMLAIVLPEDRQSSPAVGFDAVFNSPLRPQTLVEFLSRRGRKEVQ